MPNVQLNPGNIGPPSKQDEEGSTAYVKNNKDIWSVEEVAGGAHYDDVADMRPQPEYEIIQQQSVGTEDLFLGLSGKNQSSMCCEALLVKIKLPETNATDVALDVKEDFLELRTPKYKLGLHLPHPVDVRRGKAQLFGEMGELQVQLVKKSQRVY
ncbi:dynein axonemal assembly factor 6 [Brachionichthys hirsutus]|uniref:dynein axonemal assembly factor 6 n=1 Tax=Brachionichthys hirsutus TaxID=412623 RepID=UPI0036046712